MNKSVRKSACQEAIRTKTSFPLVNLFERVHVNIPTVRKHIMGQRPVRKHKYLYENV